MPVSKGDPLSLLSITTATLLANAIASPPTLEASPAPVASTEEPAPTLLASEEVGDGIVVRARSHSPGDPMEHLNAKAFAVTQDVDMAVVGPVSLAYKRALPAPVRTGVRNLLSNLHEPDVFLNFLLQLKPGKAAETLGRFVINSTIGVAGLFDVAKRRPFNLSRRPNGFADTMGYYGMKPGAFLFLPLIGPTTVRDFIGGGLDRLVLPVAVGKPFNRAAYTIPTGVVSALDRRAEFDEELRALRDGAADPYVARRELYLQKRQAEIDALRGRGGTVAPAP